MNNTKTPVVSVVMPVYNGEKYLAEAIESILNQTYVDFEFIILNDGSTDRTEEIILSHDDPRIIYVRNKENLQIVKTLNKGIALAKGKYIARMDADDISLPERFEKQVAFLESGVAKVVFSTVELMDEQSNSRGTWSDDKTCTDLYMISKVLPKRNCLAHPTLMMDASLLKHYRYNSHAVHAEDYNLWLRLVSDGINCAKIKQELVLYRVHTNSITVSQSKHIVLTYKKNILAKFFHLLYKAKKLSINTFDLRVMQYMFVDIGNTFKGVIKEPLKKLLMQTGRACWRLNPKYINADILFIFNTCNMGGAERVHLEILRAAKQYKTVTLMTNKSENRHFYTAYKKLTTLIETSAVSNNIIGRWFMAGYIQKTVEKSDIKMIFGSLSGLFYALLSSVKKGNICIVELFHAMDNHIEYHSLPESSKIDKRVFIDEGTRQFFFHLMDLYGIDPLLKQKSILIENGVPVPEILTKNNKEKPLKIVFVGRDAPEKRLHIIRKIAKQLKRVSFVFVGVPPDSLDTSNVHAVGQVQDVEPYYQDADILLMTSSREGFPMAIMEAMAHGVVVVSTDVGGVSISMSLLNWPPS